MNRIIIISFLFLSAIVAFADKKMTIRNSDSGESFEITVPDASKCIRIMSTGLIQFHTS